MKRFVTFLLLLFLPVFSVGAISIETSPEISKRKMLNDLTYIKNVFEIRYAPFLWKKKYLKWDLEREFASAKAQIVILSRPSLKEYHKILKTFFYSTRDYHVSVDFFATESAYLPLDIRGAGGRYFIVHIDRPALPAEKYPVFVGDELLSFNEKPIQQVLDKLCHAEYNPNPTPTDQALTQGLLTYRSAERGHQVPKGDVVLGVVSKETGELRSVTVPWSYTEEMVTDFCRLASNKDFPHFDLSLLEKSSSPTSYLSREATFGGWKPRTEVGASLTCENNYVIGAKKSFLPELGKPVWRAKKDSPFDAYIFLTPEFRKVGYVRIPTFGGSEEDANALVELIKKFERETEALVVDQLNNPGGILGYLYAVLSMLSDQPLTTPKHRQTLTQEDVFTAYVQMKMLEDVKTDKDAQATLGETLFGYPVTKKLSDTIVKDCEFVIHQWSKGNLFTDEAHLSGMEFIDPHPQINYTKPLLVLTNELDFSCADFFPAILQDNGRAVILGATTSGAGGFVFSDSFPNQTAIQSFRYTASIAFRKNKKPIENLGVTPDIQYTITPEDFQTDYAPYKKKILEVVDSFFEKPKDTLYEIVPL
jgi:hypothetical protein